MEKWVEDWGGPVALLLLTFASYLIFGQVKAQRTELKGLHDYVEKVERDFLMWEVNREKSPTPPVTNAEPTIPDL